MKNLTPVEKKKKLAKVIRGIWSSLDSHLDLSIESPKISKKAQAYLGGKHFHKQCVLEYSSFLKDLIEIL